MITINLLPDEFRVQEKTSTKLPAAKIAISLGLVLVVVTLYFYADFWMAKGKLAKLNKEWLVVQPQSAQLKKLEEDVEKNLKPENAFLKSSVTSSRPLTHVMGWVSEFLPPASWLVQLQMDRIGDGGKLVIKGLTLPTKEKSSIEHIEIFLNLIKEKMPDSNLSLTTSRQQIKDVEVTQFIATFEWGIPPKP